jgi:glycosyltransferase involved in cell wall biosynthesis
MKTSLIIPAWNAEKTISDCIISSLEAHNSPEEIIIVDDCSEDKTINVILNLQKKYPKIKLLRMPINSGPSAARDYGVNKAKGELLFFTDSDTIFLKNTFSNCLSTILKYNADAVSGIYHPEPINLGKTQLYKALFFYFHFFKHDEPFPYQTFNGQIGAIKKAVYFDVGGYNTDILWGMDYENEEFGRRIIKKYQLFLDPNFQVKHNFPSFKKLTRTYFMRVSTWMLIFMNDLKFESKGPAAMDSGLAAISIPLSLFFLLLTFAYSNIFCLPFICLISIWLNGYFKFYKFVFINKPHFFIYALILNIWFSTVISLGAFWGFLKWIKGERAIIKQIK